NVTEVGIAQQRRRRLRLRHGYAVQRLRPYGPYRPTGQARRAFFSNTISLRVSIPS
ncbi:hypothetical protein L249_5770, partial [Ophiocordyceps polyrhachis-furcata BCC 54312]